MERVVIKIIGGVVTGVCALAALAMFGVVEVVSALEAALDFEECPFTTVL